MQKLLKADEAGTGITIFDITDLANVGYCFVDFYGMESQREVQLMTPLPARVYLEAYYELDEANDEAGFLPLLEDLKDYPLITATALTETWPHGEWQLEEEVTKDGNNGVEDGGEETLPRIGDLSLTAESTNITERPEGGAIRNKSLRDQAMAGFLNILLDPTQNTENLIREGEFLNDFVAKLRRRWYEEAAALTPSEQHHRLLCKALENDAEVDLSPFTNFTVEHLTAIVSKLCGRKMRALNLSNRSDITESDLSTILSLGHNGTKPMQSSCSKIEAAHKDITSVVLLNTPQISVDFVMAHLGQYDTYHSELLRRPLTIHQSSRFSEEPLQALQYAGPDAVTQFVWVGISSMQSCDSKFRLDNGHFDWSKLKYSVEASSRFSGDPSLKYKNFLLDVPLPAGKTVHGLQ